MRDAIRFAFAEIATNGENFAVAIGQADADGSGKLRILALEARVPPFGPETVIKEFCKLLREHGIRKVSGDRHSTRWAFEAFKRHNISYEFCDLVRPDLHREFLKLLDEKKVVMPQHGELRRQLRALVTRQKEHGGPDDLVTAVAGVCVLAAGKCGAVTEPVEYV